MESMNTGIYWITTKPFEVWKAAKELVEAEFQPKRIIPRRSGATYVLIGDDWLGKGLDADCDSICILFNRGRNGKIEVDTVPGEPHMSRVYLWAYPDSHSETEKLFDAICLALEETGVIVEEKWRLEDVLMARWSQKGADAASQRSPGEQSSMESPRVDSTERQAPMTLATELIELQQSSRRARDKRTRLKCGLVQWRNHWIGESIEDVCIATEIISKRTFYNYKDEGLIYTDEDLRAMGVTWRELWGAYQRGELEAFINKLLDTLS